MRTFPDLLSNEALVGNVDEIQSSLEKKYWQVSLFQLFLIPFPSEGWNVFCFIAYFSDAPWACADTEGVPKAFWPTRLA